MLLMDSLAWTPGDVQRKHRAWNAVLGVLTGALQQRTAADGSPVRLHLGITSSAVQKSSEGCHIFALAAAKKMASDPAIRALHDRVLLGLTIGRIRAGVSHLDANRQLPPSLFKHTTSAKVLQRYIEVSRQRLQAAQARRQAGFTGWQRLRTDPLAPVNKKGQSLLQRHAAHSVTREDRTQPGRLLSYSNSYELKRIDLIQEALAHLTTGLGPSR